MGRRKIWQALAAVFTVVNLVGLGMAVGANETMHGGIHAVLSVLGALVMWRFARPVRDTGDSPDGEVRLEQLQQSVDAIALEVERIGEAQRFNAKLQAERHEQPR
jgi:hypothetical protein